MSILTKICVVLLVLVMLPASVVFIRQATAIPHYKQLLEAQHVRAKLLDQDRKVKDLALERAKGVIRRLGDELKVKTTDLSGQIAVLEGEVIKAQLAHNDAAALAKRLEIQIAQLQTIAADAAKRTDAALADAAELRKTINKQNEDMAIVKDQNSQLQAGLRRAEELVRVYKEREAEAVRELEAKRELLAKYIEEKGPIGKEGAGDSKVGDIRATILAVKNRIASINAGTAKGVRAGMRLVVYRNDRFVSYLKVIEVEAQEAAGLIIEPVLDAQQGDKVTSEQTMRSATAGG